MRAPLLSAFGRLRAWLGRGLAPRETRAAPRRGPVSHVVILDGTMSSLEPGFETSAGLTWRLLDERTPAPDLTVYYEPGIQFTSWRQVRDVIEGRGINEQIKRAYGWLASRYRPGDRIYLLGYSRGAYAVRSLAGVIDRVGLLRADTATQRNVELAYRHYRIDPSGAGARAFVQASCHEGASVRMVGVWDSVKALGLRAPLVWRWNHMAHRFHDHTLRPTTEHGFHALALDETRLAYAPVMWVTGNGWGGHCEQVWFRGTHGDVGGHIDGLAASRPLANIPLVWMLGKAESCGLALPEGWRARFGGDAGAPSVGMNRGWGRIFLARAPRVVGRDPSESVHPSARPHPLAPDAPGT